MIGDATFFTPIVLTTLNILVVLVAFVHRNIRILVVAEEGNTFSFSIAWSRILPFGIKGNPVSEEGVKFVRLCSFRKLRASMII